MARVVDLDEHRKKEAQRLRDYRQRTGKAANADGFLLVCSVCKSEFRNKDRNVRVCGEGGCAKQQRRSKLQPFTIPHFVRWANQVTLDTGKKWRPEQFQLDFVADVFAGVPICWLIIAEGNTKTTTLGGLALYHAQHKRNAKVPLAASSRDQAMEMWGQMDIMVTDTPMLAEIFRCQEGNRRVICDSNNSKIQVFAADERTGDGVIFTLALIDELHRHRDLKLYRTWVGKRKKRGGQVIVISTAGEPGGEFEEARMKLRNASTREEIRPGYVRALSGPNVIHDYHVPDNMNVEDMKAVKLANPFSQITLASLKEKREDLTMTLPHWTRLTCNRATRGFAAAITEAEWWRQQTDVRIPHGVPIAAGLDVAWKWDTTALVPWWERDPQFRLLGEASILEPPRNGDMLDPEEIHDALLTMHDNNPIHTLVMDMSLAADVAAWAADHLGCEIIDRAQSPQLACLDYKNFMEGLRSKWLWHVGDPGLTSHAMNAATKMYPDGKTRFIRPRKSRSTDQEQRVIDALTAASMVNSVMSQEEVVDDKPILVALV